MKYCKLVTIVFCAMVSFFSCSNPMYDDLVSDLKDDVYYTVSFVTNNGTTIPSQKILSGGKVVHPAALTRVDYTFMGWYTDANFTSSYDFNSTVRSNLKLYAGWKYGTLPAPAVTYPSSSTVCINWTAPAEVYYSLVYRRTVGTDSYMCIGKVVNATPETFLPTQCVFYDYFTKTSESYLYYVNSAKYDTQMADWVSYVTVDTDPVQGRGSSDIPSITTDFVATYAPSSGVLSFNPAFDMQNNHAQAGTYTIIFVIANNVTEQNFNYTSGFGWMNLTELTFPPSFAVNGIELDVGYKAAYIKSDPATSLVTTTYLKTGKISGDNSGIVIPGYKTSAVFYMPNGGSGSMSTSMLKEDTPTKLAKNAFTRLGHAFLGWSKNQTATTADYADEALFTVGSSNETLYAVWEALPSHTLSFDANGGDGTMSPMTIYEKTPTALSKNAFTRSGYAFLGWDTTLPATTIEYADGGLFTIDTLDATLYAVWKELLITEVYVPGGTFSMGSTTGDTDERPVHSVTVSSFYIGMYEVTQGQYAAVMPTSPVPPFSTTGDMYPVSGVTWYNAASFCNLLSAREGYQNVYTISGTTVTADFTKNGYRLPTEAEWEFAARGGTLSGGYTYSGSNTIGTVAWYSVNASSAYHIVGLKPANELGIRDMSGNVAEWCWDWYIGDYYDVSPVSDPRGPTSGTNRILRGGSYSQTATYATVSYRSVSLPSNALNTVGFRVVRSVL